MVADLYPEGGNRRDAGFSVFYSGINVGAMIGPLVCGFLGEKVNWHLGFGAATAVVARSARAGVGGRDEHEPRREVDVVLFVAFERAHEGTEARVGRALRHRP